MGAKEKYGRCKHCRRGQSVSRVTKGGKKKNEKKIDRKRRKAAGGHYFTAELRNGRKLSAPGAMRWIEYS